MSTNDMQTAKNANYHKLVLASPFESDDNAAAQNDANDVSGNTLNPVEKVCVYLFFMFIVKLILGFFLKLRRIVKTVRSSPQCRKLWLDEVSLSRRDEAGKLEELSKMLILDVRTCWTSTHQMLCKLSLVSLILQFISYNLD